MILNLRDMIKKIENQLNSQINSETIIIKNNILFNKLLIK